MISKADFAKRIADRLLIDEKDARETIDAIFDEYLSCALREPVQTPFGRLIVRRLRPRKVYLIEKGETVSFPESKVLRLLVSESVAEKVKSAKGRGIEAIGTKSPAKSDKKSEKKTPAPKRKVKSTSPSKRGTRLVAA
jgi:nucleoid DNA-binding protein